MERKQDWIRDLVVYQVYPRSFMDSNGDGIGDLNGVRQKLPYLKKLGVNALWLSPFFCSPGDDNGYDVSDYDGIQPEFGTMADCEALIRECHALGMRFIIDVVVNHSSDEHPWFIESASSRENDKSDFYIWRDPVDGHEPTNWWSVFGGSAWEYVPARGQYYFHLFSRKQPDLNWRSPQLRQQIFAMMNRWADRGVDGFRLDAASHYAKPEHFVDSTLPPMPDGYAPAFDQLSNTPETHAIVNAMNQAVFTPRQLFTVGEVGCQTPQDMQDYALPQRQEFDAIIPFIPPQEEVGKKVAEVLRSRYQSQYDALHDGSRWALFLSNHDKPRQVSSWGDEGALWEVSAKALALCLHGLPGIPFVYEGEELGMTNAYFPRIEDYRDIDSRNVYRTLLLEGKTPQQALQGVWEVSRDHARTPMQWDDSENAGFTCGTPWIGVNRNYREINAARQEADSLSVLHFYRELIALRRRYPVLRDGDLAFLPIAPEDRLLVYRRQDQGIRLLVTANLSHQPCALPDSLSSHLRTCTPLLTSYNREGNPEAGTLRPFEAILWQETVEE